MASFANALSGEGVAASGVLADELGSPVTAGEAAADSRGDAPGSEADPSETDDGAHPTAPTISALQATSRRR